MKVFSLILVFGVSPAPASGRNLRNNTTNVFLDTSTTNISFTEEGTDSFEEVDASLALVSDEVAIANAIESNLFEYLGCFKQAATNFIYRLNVDQFKDRDTSAKECAESRCDSKRFFGVSKGENYQGKPQFSCHCYDILPDPIEEYRLTFSGCSESSLPQDQKMSFYFNTADQAESCAVDDLLTLRNRMVGTGEVKFGYDLIHNTFAPSNHFKLFNEGCSTNIFTLSPETMSTRAEVLTQAEQVATFATNRRLQVKTSLSHSTGGSGVLKKIFQIGGKVSFSLDNEFTSTLKSSGAQEDSSRVFTATGVDGVANVYVDNFESKRYFVTLSKTFIDAIRDYKTCGYCRSEADHIIREYGHVVLTR